MTITLHKLPGLANIRETCAIGLNTALFSRYLFPVADTVKAISVLNQMRDENVISAYALGGELSRPKDKVRLEQFIR